MKKTALLSLLVAIFSLACNLQPVTANPSPTPDEGGYVFTVVDERPVLPFDEQTMFDKLKVNIKDVDPAGEPCKVFVQCIVEKDGTISNHTVFRSSGNEKVDAYAIELVKKVIPAFKEPGKQSGNPVRVRYVFPVRFQ